MCTSRPALCFSVPRLENARVGRAVAAVRREVVEIASRRDPVMFNVRQGSGDRIAPDKLSTPHGIRAWNSHVSANLLGAISALDIPRSDSWTGADISVVLSELSVRLKRGRSSCASCCHACPVAWNVEHVVHTEIRCVLRQSLLPRSVWGQMMSATGRYAVQHVNGRAFPWRIANNNFDGRGTSFRCDLYNAFLLQFGNIVEDKLSAETADTDGRAPSQRAPCWRRHRLDLMVRPVPDINSLRSRRRSQRS